MLVVQTSHFLLMCGLRLGEGCLQPFELGSCLVVCLSEGDKLLLMGDAYVGERLFESFDLFREVGEACRLRDLRMLGIGLDGFLGRDLVIRLDLVLGLDLRFLGRDLGIGLDLFDLHRGFVVRLDLFLGLGRSFLGLGAKVLNCALHGLGDRVRLVFAGRLGCLDGLRLLGLLAGASVLGGRLVGLDPNRRDGRRREAKLGQPDTGLVGLTLCLIRAHAEGEAVLGPQSSPALHGQCVRHRRTRGEAELYDDLPEWPLRALLHLEDRRELLVRDQSELGHELADLTLRRRLRLGGRAHDCGSTCRRITALLSASVAADLIFGSAGRTSRENAISRDGGRLGSRRELRPRTSAASE